MYNVYMKAQSSPCHSGPEETTDTSSAMTTTLTRRPRTLLSGEMLPEMEEQQTPS